MTAKVHVKITGQTLYFFYGYHYGYLMFASTAV